MPIPIMKIACAFLATIAVTVVFLVVGFGVKAWWIRTERDAVIPSTSPQAKFASKQQQLLPSIATISGIPVLLTQARVSLNSGAKTVSYSLYNQGGDDATAVQLLLLDFDQKGQLQFVNGWIENVGLGFSQKRNFTYDLRTAATSESRMAMVIVDVKSSRNHWRVSPGRVVQSLVNVAANRPENLPIANLMDLNSNGYEPDFCFMATQQVSFPPETSTVGQALGVTFFTCDQYLRSYAYGYRMISAQ